MEYTNPELLRRAQAIGEDIKEIESIDSMFAYNKAQKIIINNKRKMFHQQLMRYAALLTLPLLITSLVFGYLFFHEPILEDNYAEVTAAAGSVIRYELPDHSIVWLNAGTKMRYPTSFRKDNRIIELDGEAYFEVKADEESPFYVNTSSGLSVYVYGTEFNVVAYNNDNYIETVLLNGKVNVISPKQEHVVLSPGEELHYNKSSKKLTKNMVNVYDKVAWKEGKLIFRNSTLEEIFKRLERHFNVEIEFNNLDDKEYRYRATFQNETLSQILDYFAQSAALKWKMEDAKQNENYTFTKKRIIINLH